MMFNFLFFMFSACLISASLVVVLARNTVYSVIGLIFAFINAAILMLMVNAEFLAFVVMIVYVGAVAVLFLFVVMMLNLGGETLKTVVSPYMKSVGGMFVVVLAEIIALCYYYHVSDSARDLLGYPRFKQTENTMALGQLIYTDFALIFQVSGLILLVAMLGAIVITSDVKKNAHLKKQDVRKQMLRSKSSSLVMTSPAIGQGVTPEMSESIIKNASITKNEESKI